MTHRRSTGLLPVSDVYSAGRWITVAETSIFRARARACLTEDGVSVLTTKLARDPTCGVVIPGTGGLRKLRFAAGGRGQRGGVRVIYYFYNETMPVFLMTAYAKTQKEDLTADEKRALVAIAAAIVASYRGKL